MTIHNAPAKINLMLHITRKGDCGFHYLQSLITFLGNGDQINVGESSEWCLNVDGPFSRSLPIDGNLVLKTVEWLRGLYPKHPKAYIGLSKNLPLSSGIGGGSSDAAAAIVALLDLWNVELNESQKIDLIKLSGSLGADVPVCLAHHLLKRNFFWIDGTGKEGTPVSLWKEEPQIHILLVNPGISVSTPDIFRAYNKAYDNTVSPPVGHEELLDFLRKAKNSLTFAACELVPEISEVLKMLSDTPGCLLARMSGSGATCFGIYESAYHCKNAQHIMKKAHPEWWVMS